MVQNSKVAQLMAEDVSLRQAIPKKSCFTCGGATVHAKLLDENQCLLMENGRLRGQVHTTHTSHTHSTVSGTHMYR
jgi:hypothetical protein